MPRADIDVISDHIVEETAAARPIKATYYGIAGHDHEIEDFSTAGLEACRRMRESQLARVTALPPTSDEWDSLAVRVMTDSLQDDLAWFSEGEHFRDLNSIDSTLQNVRQAFDFMDRETPQGWEAVAQRLQLVPQGLEAYADRLEEARVRGLTVARRQVVDCMRQARAHGGKESFALALVPGVTDVVPGDAALHDRVAAGVVGLQAAFSQLADYLEAEYLTDAVLTDGVGEERYLLSARRFLGDDLDARETYEWGWSEVLRLRERMAAVAGEISPGASLPEALEILATDPERAAPSQEAFRQLILQRLEQALSQLDGLHFDVAEPMRRVDVKLAAPDDPLGAYYVSPSEDHARPGTVWWSLGRVERVPLFDAVSTAYHEGFPGHHLQDGVQVMSDRLTRFQKRMIWHSGSGEGWALYAEDLMEELGYLDRPDYVMGKLSSEMLRASRVVIDIGSHLGLPIPAGQPFHPGEGWAFEKGIEMLVDYAGLASPVARSEILRYLGWPGQAIAYKVGQRVIRDLRSNAQKNQGAAFDQKAFHARLLSIGAPGLGVVKDWMAN